MNLIESEDIFARYKCPKIKCIHQSHGYKAVTIIENTKEICAAINLKDPLILSVFFTHELHTGNVRYTNEKILIHGAHTNMELDPILNKYINLFSLCKKCALPETHFTTSTKDKKKRVYMSCDACGYEHQINHDRMSNIIRARLLLNPRQKIVDKKHTYNYKQSAVNNKDLTYEIDDGQWVGGVAVGELAADAASLPHTP